MTQYEIEQYILACIVIKPSLINELYIDTNCFSDDYHKWLITFLKKAYDKFKRFDPVVLTNAIKDTNSKSKFIIYFNELQELVAVPGSFYEYQEMLVDYKKENLIKKKIKSFENKKITSDELYEEMTTIINDSMIIQKENKVSPEEMIKMIRNKDKLLEFYKFMAFNEKLHFKKNTINVIAARPSEGKSALALNLFCDLVKTYKCLYFNMEMTETEVYERMLAIESNIPLLNISTPETEYQEKQIKETANKIYTYNYEVINGSKTVNAIKNKIIREQREGHVVIFIDYIGYIVGKKGQNDRERIGDAVRELNNITKDYDCTIFLVAQINRQGTDKPTMQDLKDSGELEQTADTIILIHDENKEDKKDIKEIKLMIPKCRSGRRGVQLETTFDKSRQIMKVR
jgi:replicative DNA helicase